MNSKVKIIFTLCIILFLSLSMGIASAGFIDFENGVDRMAIASTIPGLEFTTTMGYDWIYGDWRTGMYNGPYPLGSYYSDGNFFAWLGENQGSGVITFTQSYATYFKIDYSTYSIFYLEAYDDLGNILDTDTGFANLDTGTMGTLQVNAPGMAYVIVHDTGNYWLIDNLDTDAISECTLDVHCDDGVFCNGIETCELYQCLDGEPVECEDDGLWCNGDEICDADADECISEFTATSRCPDDSLYCNGAESCDDVNDTCVSSGDPCPDDGKYCNGTESCDESGQSCVSSGNPCGEDGLFCNGNESCDEAGDSCVSSGDPCPADTTCDEDDDLCDPRKPDDPDVSDDDDDAAAGEEDMWPKGEVTGGCCGC